MNRLFDGRLSLPFGLLLMKAMVVELLLEAVIMRLSVIAKWQLWVMSKDSGCLDFFSPSAWYFHRTRPICCAELLVEAVIVRLSVIAKCKLCVMSKDGGCLDFFSPSVRYFHRTRPICCAELLVEAVIVRLSVIAKCKLCVMSKDGGCLDFFSPSARLLAISGNSRRTPRRLSKRRFIESGTSDRDVDGGCISVVSQGQSKRSKQICGYLSHRLHNPAEKWPERSHSLWVRLENLMPGLLPAEKREDEAFKEPAVTVWDDLPADIHEKILHRLEFRGLSRFKALSKSCKNYVESAAFRQSRAEVSEGSFTAIIYYIKHRAWQFSGYDLHTKSWRALPPLSYLPPPDAELFKEYSVCGHGGLMCAEVSKSPKKGEFVVFNPVTGEKKALPPLLFPRNPVLVHIVVNSAQKSYKVIVAGSSTASDEHLSRKMEIFDSSTLEWKETLDLPGPTFGLNEHQTGVCLNGILFFISFLAGACRRGVVAFAVAKGQWLTNMTCPIPFSSSSNTLQLVESDGKLYLFSEQERGAIVEHCIDEMKFPNPKAGVTSCQWRNVVRVSKSGGRGLLVYPEYTCVGFGEGKLSIFNTLNRDGVVYDMRDGRQCEVLEKPPAGQKGDNFFSLNPASFTIQPSFDSDPSYVPALSVDAISLNRDGHSSDLPCQNIADFEMFCKN